jgi:hypothetical protein
MLTENRCPAVLSVDVKLGVSDRDQLRGGEGG